MKIQLADNGPTIDIPEDADEAAVAAAICATDEAKAAAADIARKSGFAAYQADRDMDQAVADRIAAAFLEGGMERVNDMFMEESWDAAPEHDYDSWVSSDIKARLRQFAERACEAMEDSSADWLDSDAVLEECADILKEEACQAMIDADRSSPADAIPSHTVVEMAFVPGYHDGYIDDLHMNHWDVVFSAETAFCDANLMNFLGFMNVSPREFIEACRKRDFDPSAPAADARRSELHQRYAEENALRWRAVLDVEEGRTENVSMLPLSGRAELEDWNRTIDLVRSCRDHDRPQAVPMDALLTIMDNATYGGVPTWVARLPLRQVLDGSYSQPFTAKGGFIGIHDFINGSGHIEQLKAEILVDPSKGAFKKPGQDRWSVDDVYGIIGSYYRAETVPASPDGWKQARPGTWRRTAPDGRVAEISRDGSSAGEEEFRVLTMNGDLDPAGPRETAEAWSTLHEAKKDGDAALEREWTAAPSP